MFHRRVCFEVCIILHTVSVAGRRRRRAASDADSCSTGMRAQAATTAATSASVTYKQKADAAWTHRWGAMFCGTRPVDPLAAPCFVWRAQVGSEHLRRLNTVARGDVARFSVVHVELGCFHSSQHRAQAASEQWTYPRKTGLSVHSRRKRLHKLHLPQAQQRRLLKAPILQSTTKAIYDIEFDCTTAPPPAPPASCAAAPPPHSAHPAHEDQCETQDGKWIQELFQARSTVPPPAPWSLRIPHGSFRAGAGLRTLPCGARCTRQFE